jgi:acyl carrier protein
MSANIAVAKTLLAKALELPVESLPDNAGIDSMETWDSLAHVRVLSALEAALGRPMASDEIVAIVRLADIVAALDRGQSAI